MDEPKVDEKLKSKLQPKRITGTLLVKPIVSGSIAFWLGKKAQETKSHKWSIYVRGVHGEDLSYFIKKVVFQLHPTFTNPQRVLTRPPFEIEEFGWGEFEIIIRIYFIDPIEKPVELFHPLKLYPLGDVQLTTKKPVVSEFYDELLFQDPTQLMYDALMRGPTSIPPPNPLAQFWIVFDEEADKKLLLESQSKLHAATKQLQDRLKTAQGEIERLNAVT